MNVGMLWFDNDPKANLDSKIERAALYYRDKYGRRPTLCFVHPSMLNGKAEPAAQTHALLCASQHAQRQGGARCAAAFCRA